MANCVKSGSESDLSQQQYLKCFNLMDDIVGNFKWRCWFERGHCLRLQVIGSSHQEEESDNNQTECQGFKFKINLNCSSQL